MGRSFVRANHRRHAAHRAPRIRRSNLTAKKPEGKFIVRCKHGVPYSVYYAADGLHYNKDTARERIEEFRATHCMFAPDCTDVAVVEDIVG
jgi:hypothetical protein